MRSGKHLHDEPLHCFPLWSSGKISDHQRSSVVHFSVCRRCQEDTAWVLNSLTATEMFVQHAIHLVHHQHCLVSWFPAVPVFLSTRCSICFSSYPRYNRMFDVKSDVAVPEEGPGVHGGFHHEPEPGLLVGLLLRCSSVLMAE